MYEFSWLSNGKDSCWLKDGEFRDREKGVRGIKKTYSVIIDGYQLYHNYVRPHMALDDKTPADMCGIEIQGLNKWKTIIENASRP